MSRAVLGNSSILLVFNLKKKKGHSGQLIFLLWGGEMGSFGSDNRALS